MQRIGFWGAIATIVIAMSATAQSEEFRLDQPIDCDLGQDCFIQQYFDHDPSEGAQDFACSGAVYNGHGGTDFRVTYAKMRQGVAIVAPADGVVAGVRDGMADVAALSEEALADVAQKKCGNGVSIDHGDGWRTQMCHMKKGSVVARFKQKVKAGDVLGQVGLSGNTQFPHLHISVYRDGKKVDPFSISSDYQLCGFAASNAIWTERFAADYTYSPTQVIDIGLAGGRVSRTQTQQGVFDDFVPSRIKPIVAYTTLINLQTGDQIGTKITGPKGQISQTLRKPFERNKAEWFLFAGKKPPKGGWEVGDYRAEVFVLRDEEVLVRRTRNFVMR